MHSVDLYRRYINRHHLPIEDTNRLALRAMSERKCLMKLYGDSVDEIATSKVTSIMREGADMAILEMRADSKLAPKIMDLSDASLSPFCREY